jgi:RHS repeat-associated protein
MQSVEGVNLYSTPSRLYDPLFGSFLARDPRLYSDSPSPYVYAAHNPVDFADPSGRDKTPLGGPAASETPAAEVERLKTRKFFAFNMTPDETGLLGPQRDFYSVAYGLKHVIVAPIVSAFSDDRPKYLDANQKEQTISWKPDRSAELSVAFGTIASLFLPTPKTPLMGGAALEEIGTIAELPAEELVAESGSEGSWIRLARSRAEADAFNRTTQQIEGQLPRPSNKLGGGPKKWGATFHNTPLQTGRPPELPIELGPYREYTTLLPGQATRGQLRTVIGANGEVFTTWSHYGEAQVFPANPLEPLPRVTFLRSR